MDLYYWFDVFDSLRPQRRQLAELVIRLGNREFSEICQKWLHEKGRIDLSPIWIGKVFGVGVGRAKFIAGPNYSVRMA
jgi:hypothetical protein